MNLNPIFRWNACINNQTQKGRHCSTQALGDDVRAAQRRREVKGEIWPRSLAKRALAWKIKKTRKRYKKFIIYGPQTSKFSQGSMLKMSCTRPNLLYRRPCLKNKLTKNSKHCNTTFEINSVHVKTENNLTLNNRPKCISIKTSCMKIIEIQSLATQHLHAWQAYHSYLSYLYFQGQRVTTTKPSC